MTEEEIQDWKDAIDFMSHEEMARLYRFAPAGHPVFNVSLPLDKYFQNKFEELGGMTSEVSKIIGFLRGK